MLSIPDALRRHGTPDGLALAERGEFWSPGGLAEYDSMVSIRRAGRMRFRHKFCFSNALRLAGARSDIYRYVEGCAKVDARADYVVWHAWVVTTDDRVADPTWYGHEPVSTDAQYFGIVPTWKELFADNTLRLFSEGDVFITLNE